ncbi:gamma-glutamylcyclotransferase family protein [Flexibacterium corallicola]|uniref:gamma-glutamylcyclotransferase family protein n=1 Tax=Flexibacterium corallicola TaxID=3037259 RepID=UPI00286FAA0E|nr:gamma-glutamylcyclotransferase family protein [Pseudovibrio sp. M1P-2-3]
MPLYFAYGRLMNVDEMKKRCVSAKPLGTATLEGFQFIVTKEGAPSVLKQPGAVTHGVLWDCRIGEIGIIDGNEALFRRGQDKVLLNVRCDGMSRKALVYISLNRQKGRAQAKAFDPVLPAAEHWNFPAIYRAHLESFTK